ncbi:MAG: FHA domain-containing protein [SAR324 cluster bacterium]|nr:FHA domain-containing protein [SAR324 cluster bacterium]
MFTGSIANPQQRRPFCGGVGGLLGGLSMEYSRLVLPQTLYARLIGFLIFGVALGLFYGLVRSRFSMGRLMLLNGKSKGREFLLLDDKVTIGSSADADIVLSENEYQDISAFHAELCIHKRDLLLKPLGKKSVQINEVAGGERALKLNDVLKIGSAKFIYLYQ